MSFYYKIAGFTLCCEEGLDEASLKALKAYESEPVEQADIHFTFHFNCLGLPEPEGELVTEIHARRWYRMSDGGYAFVDQADVISKEIINLVRMSNGFSKVEAWFCPMQMLSLDVEKRPYHLMGEVLKYAVLQQGGLVIHASSLAYDGKGVLFSAPSGTGKSTHTELWKTYKPGTVIVNDDMPVIRIENGEPLLCGTPWSGKNSINTNVSVPLKAIIFLKRGKTCSLTKMEPIEAVWRIYDAVRKPVVSELASEALDRIEEILQKVPVFQLACDISEEAVITAAKSIEA
ncbi:MAG: hypothetical protein E7418_01765 [Ruminococcaceae bacterium]|nr:hypothetical protein [Oscillospiraceae bacterium]